MNHIFTIQAGGRHAPIHPDAPKMIKVGKDEMKFDEKHSKNTEDFLCASVQEYKHFQTLLISTIVVLLMDIK